MKKIKQLKIINQDESTEIANIGADAINVDYNDTTVKAELDKLNTSDSLLINTQTSQGTKLVSLQSQIDGLSSGSPKAVTSISEMTDTSKIYVNVTNGKWYYYNGSEWVVGGDYQAPQDSETVETIANSLIYKEGKNKYNRENNIANTCLSQYGTTYSTANYFTSGKIDVSKLRGQTIYFSKNGVATNYYCLCSYKENNDLIERNGDWKNNYTIPENASYIRFSMGSDNINTNIQVEVDEVTDYEEYYNPYYSTLTNEVKNYTTEKINDLQVDGRNVESKKLPFNYNYNKFVNNFKWEEGPITIDSATNQLVFGGINVNYPRLRTPENEGIIGNNNYLQIFNLNSDVYSYRMFWKDSNNKGYTERDYFKDEYRKFYLENGNTYYIQFLNKNNVKVTVEEVINNFKIAIGNSQNTPAVKIMLGNTFNGQPNIDTNNKTLTFQKGTLLYSMKNQYAIEGTLDLLSTGSFYDVIVYDIDNNMLKVEPNISNIAYRFLLIGTLKYLIQNNKLRIINFSIPCEYSIDGIKKDILLSGLNTNINNKLISGNISATGQITSFDHRVISSQPFEYNGIIKIKVPSDIRPNVVRFDKQNKYLNHIVGVTGQTLVASLSSQYNYYLQFDSDPDMPLDPLYVIENIHIDYLPISETLIDYNIKSNIDSIGHQGFGAGTNGFRGNSRSGFIAGAKYGFSSLECDMGNTSDNVLVLTHDNDITDDDGNQITISKTTYEDLLKHTFDGETICTLDEFMKICKIYGCNAVLDKTGTITNSPIRMNNVKNIIQKYYMEDKVTFTPYSLAHIPLIYNLNSNYKQSYQMFNAELDEQWYKDFVNLKGNNKGELSISIDYNQLNETVYEYCRKYNIKICAFTIDNLDTYKQFMPFVSAITSNKYKSVDALD